ncbi:unnamed protein product [Phaedon cochleariae]|uniref:Uncharacterized protein n=1 Tax=Phaedon cochleariae TaxID=80249 RepID=A0A9N9SAH8_PHACE|nr:unnamed protein product [Phaedon cochleariae]
MFGRSAKRDWFLERKRSSNDSDSGGCQFKKSWQGRWFQSGVPNYLLINSSFIETKGECYEENNDKFLIYDKSDDCYRCMVIHPKHVSVLQFKETFCESKGSLQDICQLITGDAPLYSLFRKSPEARPIACPFKGAPFTFSYNRMTGDCSNPPSRAESCTDDSLEELVCLATWKEGSTRYLIGKISQFDRRSASDEDQYRCFIYQRSQENGRTVYNVAQLQYDIVTEPSSDGRKGQKTAKIHANYRFSSRKWHAESNETIISSIGQIVFEISALKVSYSLLSPIGAHRLDHHKTYRFSQRNATLKIMDDDPPKPNRQQNFAHQQQNFAQPQQQNFAQPQQQNFAQQQQNFAPQQQNYAQAFAFEEFGFRSQDQRRENSEMRVVCHGILQQQEQKKLQQTENYVENPDEACANFDTSTAPYTTLITTTLHPKKCPQLGRYTVAGISTQAEKRKKRQQPVDDKNIVTNQKPDCVSNDYEALAVGCSGSHEMEFRSTCSPESSAYSCHGSWEENGISYVITTPVSRKSTDNLRYCFIYTLAPETDAGVLEGSLGKGVGPPVLRLSGVSESCHRTVVPGVTGNWAFNFTRNGTCAESDVSNSSQLLVPTLILAVLSLLSVIIMR